MIIKLLKTLWQKLSAADETKCICLPLFPILNLCPCLNNGNEMSHDKQLSQDTIRNNITAKTCNKYQMTR